MKKYKVNLTSKTIYTYMGTLKPRAGNANYCSAGQVGVMACWSAGVGGIRSVFMNGIGRKIIRLRRTAFDAPYSIIPLLHHSLGYQTAKGTSSGSSQSLF